MLPRTVAPLRAMAMADPELRDLVENAVKHGPAQGHRGAIALEVGGRAWSTEQLAAQLDGWMHGGRDVALLVGGPEGLGEAARAERTFVAGRMPCSAMRWVSDSKLAPSKTASVSVTQSTRRS